MSSVAKQKQDPGRKGFVASIFQAGVYKPNQGKVVRQVTFFTFGFLGCLVAWEVQRSLLSGMETTGFLLMMALAAALVWVAFRSVNYSVFADFLISVEAEMNKVSWPSRRELWNASMVVIFVIFSMAFFLFLFDAVWTLVFEAIGIRYSDGGSMFGSFLEYMGWR